VLRHKKSQFFATILLVTTSLLSHMASAAPSLDLWKFWEPQNPASTEVVDHALWQQWLDRYLVSQTDGTTAVRYKAVDESGRQLVDDYIEQLADIDPRTLNRPEQFAYWVNLYNAVTVQVVLDNPDEDSITKMGDGWFNSGPWDDELVTIADQAVTLNDIEHRILRPIWLEKRIHFVVNCASIGCPNLSAQALTAANTQDQLAAAELAFINNPKGISIDSDGDLVISKIFQWYGSDFANNESEFVRYLSQVIARAPDAKVTPELLARKFGDASYEYDWSVNAAN